MKTTKEALKIMKNFIDLLDSVEKRHCELISLVKELEAEQSDLLHEFEFDTFYRTEGFRKSRRLQKLRKERRTAKDQIELFYPIKEFAKAHRGLKKNIQDTLQQVSRVESSHNSRVYTARAEKGSNISGQHFDAGDVDISDKLVNIEKKRKERFA